MEENPALFAKAAYEMDSAGDKETRIERTQNFIDKEIPNGNWKVVPEHSNRHMTTFVNDERIHISHKGTNPTSVKDLKADVSIALGQEKKDSLFSLRKTKTENALKAYPDKKASGSSHSLGGSTLYDAALSSKYVGDRMERIDTYNQGVSIFTGRVYPSRERNLKEKITIHRTRGDPVSASAVINRPVGKLKTYKAKEESGNLPQRILTQAFNIGFAQKGLDAHSI
ncbi:MAG TPA: hypothetical protein DEG69_07595, partial [Flavobacteriaceae bacterium]|nr:hypothetical protein [Flavobacteriaceae bacterium]